MRVRTRLVAVALLPVVEQAGSTERVVWARRAAEDTAVRVLAIFVVEQSLFVGCSVVAVPAVQRWSWPGCVGRVTLSNGLVGCVLRGHGKR